MAEASGGKEREVERFLEERKERKIQMKIRNRNVGGIFKDRKENEKCSEEMKKR